MAEFELPPITTDLNPSRPNLSPARSSMRNSHKSSEMMAVWGVLLVLGFMGIGYAFRLAIREEEAVERAPEPVVRVVHEEEPAPARAPTPRPAPAPVAKRRYAPAPRPVVAEKQAPTHIVEESIVETPKKMVDPIQGFDSGEAFDNPTYPGRGRSYTRRSSGLVPPMNPPAQPPQ